MDAILKYALYATLLAIVALFINSLFVGNVNRRLDDGIPTVQVQREIGEYKVSMKSVVNAD